MRHCLKHIFFWLSGAGTKTLELCPDWEQRKYVAFGAAVLVPCLFAFIAGAYAISTLTNDHFIIFFVAAVWAFIILSIDRALLTSYRPYQSWYRKLGQFTLRFIVAILMGITIAHPLVLLLFRDTITTEIEEHRATDISRTRVEFSARKEQINSAITGIEKEIANQRALWAKTFQSEFILEKPRQAESKIEGLTEQQKDELKAALAAANTPYATCLTDVDTQLASLTAAYEKNQSELGFWQAEFEHELNGQRSGLVGEGPRARSIRADQLEPRNQESVRLSGLIDQLTNEKSVLQRQIQTAERNAVASYQEHLVETRAANKKEELRIAELKAKVQQNQADTFVTQQDALRATIKTQIDLGVEALASKQREIDHVVAEESSKMDAIVAQARGDILTRTLALHSLFRAGGEEGLFAIWTYLVLTCLFMCVDTIPVVVKFFTKPGPYDTLLDRDEVFFAAGHKAFLDGHARYTQQLSSGNLMAVTCNRRLESALLEGVEHSRAAREFLDSLIEMERSFAKKIEKEQETGLARTPESLAALEAIKRSFYDDLHRRMETFFTGEGSPARS